jgi:nucleoredoxin
MRVVQRLSTAFILAVLVTLQVVAEEEEVLDLDLDSTTRPPSWGPTEEVSPEGEILNYSVPPSSDKGAVDAPSEFSQCSEETSDEGTVDADSQPKNEPAQSSKAEEVGDADAPPLHEPAESSDDLPLQSGPFIDLLGPILLSLEMVDETHAQLQPNLTNDALEGKKVIGLYFSADWCGPCRKFTPELNSFYDKINSRRGRKDQFEIVWISRCRDTNSYGQYFSTMAGWSALPPEEAMGQRGQMYDQSFVACSLV